MCIVNHAIPMPAYLISARVESFAPPAICSRILQNYREMELSDEQIHLLLDIAREYQEEYVKVSTKFAKVTADLDLVEVKANLPRKKRLLDRHAKLFRDHENLLLDAYERIQEVLSRKQMRKAAEIYEREKTLLLDGLQSSLRKAVAQKFTVRRRKSSQRTK